MGQKQSKEQQNYTQLLHKLLKQVGIQISTRTLIKMALKIIKRNPWFLQVGTLDLEDWNKMGENLKNAHYRGNKCGQKHSPVWY